MILERDPRETSLRKLQDLKNSAEVFLKILQNDALNCLKGPFYIYSVLKVIHLELIVEAAQRILKKTIHN